MQLRRTTPKGWPHEVCHGQSSVLYRMLYIVLFLYRDTFLGRFYTKVVGNTQNSKKNLRTGVYFANFYVYFFCMNLMGIRKMGEIGLKMAPSDSLPPPM